MTLFQKQSDHQMVPESFLPERLEPRHGELITKELGGALEGCHLARFFSPPWGFINWNFVASIVLKSSHGLSWSSYSEI